MAPDSDCRIRPFHFLRGVRGFVTTIKSSSYLKKISQAPKLLYLSLKTWKIILIYIFVISTLSNTNTDSKQIDLGFHCFNLDINWKIHGILCQKRSGNPASVLTHFKIFITKICMKVPGIWHKKPWKNLEFRTKILRKPGICYLKKVGTLSLCQLWVQFYANKDGTYSFLWEK